MKRVLVKSVYDAFEYVMQHYYPAGLEDMVEKSDTYAVISIQDSHTNGFGITFDENQYCKGVLTLLFDDIVREVEGAVPFSEEMAIQIIKFIRKHKDVDTLLIHCYAGQSRSRAVGAFAFWMLGVDNSDYIEKYNFNTQVYNKLMETVWYVHEEDQNTDDEVCIELLTDPILSDEELQQIEYKGNEFSVANECLEKFCQKIAATGTHMSYLADAYELYERYGEMSSILADEVTSENKRKLAILAAEITRIVGHY